MKWFHHECSARHDPKLQTLGASFGAEGLGIYWALLEEIGGDSDTFHLKVSGISEECDQKFGELLRGSGGGAAETFGRSVDAAKIPSLSLRILARNLFVTTRKLQAVITMAVEIGLFDSFMWREYSVLYSPSFEHRADDYTRRLQRRADVVRTFTGPAAEGSRTSAGGEPVEQRISSDSEPPEPDTKQNVCREEVLSECDVPSTDENSTGYPQGHPIDFLLKPTPEQFEQYVMQVKTMISNWNQEHREKFDWVINEHEITKLFYGGQSQHKIQLCNAAFQVRRRPITYPDLVFRAISLMLEASTKIRIQNPFGWLWASLHGTGDGAAPWVQLLTAEEERLRNRPP